MKIRILLPSLAVLLASACASTPYDDFETPDIGVVRDTIAECGGKNLCAATELLTKSFNENQGDIVTQGVTLRNATNNGRRVTLNLNVSDQFPLEDIPQNSSIEEELAKVMTKDLCRKSTGKWFFDMGGEFQVNMHFLSGSRPTYSTLTTCNK